MQVAIIGTGYVGLVTGACLARLDSQVTCVDVIPERVAAVNAGVAPFHEPGLEGVLRETRARGRLEATCDVSRAVGASDITIITVGTATRDGTIDLSGIAGAAREIGAALRRSDRYQLVVVKSTVVPGTTDTLVREIVERESGVQAGEFGLCMNPEFLREGSAIDDFMNPDR